VNSESLERYKLVAEGSELADTEYDNVTLLCVATMLVTSYMTGTHGGKIDVVFFFNNE